MLAKVANKNVGTTQRFNSPRTIGIPAYATMNYALKNTEKFRKLKTNWLRWSLTKVRISLTFLSSLQSFDDELDP